MGGQKGQPPLHINAEGQTATADEHRHFPAADCGHQEPWRAARPAGGFDLRLDGRPCLRREPLLIRIGPPDQHMGVEQNHASASQS
jgi:hypothetical protein